MSDELETAGDAVDAPRRPRRGRELAQYIGPFAAGGVAIMRASLVRDFVRSEIIPQVIGRLYDIGMGNTTFDEIVPGSEGGIVQVEAPAGVQVAALKELVAIGIPRQLGVLDGGDREIPGVFVLGEAKLDEAREIAGQGEFMGTGSVDRGLDVGMQRRIEAGEFEVVELDETDATNDGQAEQDNLADLPELPLTLEQQFLAERRRSRNGSNGNGNGRKL